MTSIASKKDSLTYSDLELPQATIFRLLRQEFPSEAPLRKEVKLAFTKASTLFVSYLTAASLDVYERRGVVGARILNGEHVLVALEECGFGAWKQELQQHLHSNYTDKSTNGNTGGDVSSGDEALIRKADFSDDAEEYKEESSAHTDDSSE